MDGIRCDWCVGTAVASIEVVQFVPGRSSWPCQALAKHLHHDGQWAIAARVVEINLGDTSPVRMSSIGASNMLHQITVLINLLLVFLLFSVEAF
jgi:hypothetical protein